MSKTILVKPPKAAQRQAREALRILKELPASKRYGYTRAEAASEGIRSGISQAKLIAAGKAIPAMPVHRFFSRFKGKYIDAMSKGLSRPEENKTVGSWWLWGGDTMKRAVEKALRKHGRIK